MYYIAMFTPWSKGILFSTLKMQQPILARYSIFYRTWSTGVVNQSCHLNPSHSEWFYENRYLDLWGLTVLRAPKCKVFQTLAALTLQYPMTCQMENASRDRINYQLHVIIWSFCPQKDKTEPSLTTHLQVASKISSDLWHFIVGILT